MAIVEGIVLNGLNLNPLSGTFQVETIDFTPPKKKPEWAQSADGDGAGLIREPKYENRVITASVRVQPQASMNLALEKVGELVDVLQEAEKNPGGIPLEWTPANSTKTITFYVLTGEVTSIPIVNEGNDAGYFAAAPKVNISLTCKPFGYGAEVTGKAATANETGLSIVTLTVPTVEGDVAAEARLIVKDTAGGGVGRRFVEWGLEQRYYNAATSLVLDSEDMTPVGGTQSTALNALGAYKRAGATKGSIITTLLSEPTICANTGVLKHVGTFRVKARIWVPLQGNGTIANVHVRMSWQDGEGPLRANAWQTPVTNETFVEVDLGTITISPAITGTQKWLGQIEAYSTNLPPAGNTLHIDYLTFIPAAEGYGKARGVQSSAPGTVTAFDDFSTVPGALNARTPQLGSAWATSGSTTDFVVGLSMGFMLAKRATLSDSGPRFAVLGSALTNMTAAMKAQGLGGAGYTRASIARWVNATNYVALLHKWADEVNAQLQIVKVVAGVSTVLAEAATVGTPFKETTISLTATADGGLQGSLVQPGGLNVTLSASDASVATGGALASGKGGFYDYNPAATTFATRVYTGMRVSQILGIPYCIQPSRTMEVRSDSAIVADSTGAYFGPVPQYRGSRFYVPQDGSANRTSRILVKADRNDLEESDQSTIADALTAEAKILPRFLVIPR